MAKKNDEGRVSACLGLDSPEDTLWTQGRLIESIFKCQSECRREGHSSALSSVKAGKPDFLFASAENIDDFEGGLSLTFDLCQKQFVGIKEKPRMMAGTNTSILREFG